MADRSEHQTVRIVLQGGGRLPDVSQIVEIRLEPGHLTWQPTDDGALQVTGEIHTYLYCIRAGERQVTGEGLRVPFSQRVQTGVVPAAEAVVVLHDLSSDHDFNPVTGDFQHRIVGLLRLEVDGRRTPPAQRGGGHAPKSPSPEPPGEESGDRNPKPNDSGGREPELGSISGETRMSQIRVGNEEAPGPDQVTNEDMELSQKVDEDVEGDPRPDSDSNDATEKKSGGTLVWKPFPPPIV